MAVSEGATTVGAHPDEQASLRRARRLLWTSLVFAILSFGVGAAWDRAWHTTQPFEDFWSPPHLFIYATNGIATLIALRLALSPELARHFGPPLRILGRDIASGLFLVVGGFAIVGLAGFFDSVWHNRFGLNETAWSFPHAMLGSGILLAILGFLSARLALAERMPAASWAIAILAALGLSTAVGVLLGPLDNNRTIEQVQAIARIPVLAAEPEFQHTVRIYEQWHLARTSPAFVPLSALAVGVGLAFAREIVRRRWVFVTIAVVLTFLQLNEGRDLARALRLSDTPASWAPIPIVVPALVLAVLPDRRASWAAAGAGYGLVAAAIWTGGLGQLILASALMPLGALLGRRLADVVRRPVAGAPRLVLILGLALPAVTGVIDLILRARTP